MKKEPKSAWRPLTAANAVRRVIEGDDPWLPFGQFLDDWRAVEPATRLDLVSEPLPDVHGEHIKWAALFAAAVDSLCDQDNLGAPAWIHRAEYRLPEPWFLYPGLSLRAWQLVETPAPFKMRNIFGGDRILSRV